MCTNTWGRCWAPTAAFRAVAGAFRSAMASAIRVPHEFDRGARPVLLASNAWGLPEQGSQVAGAGSPRLPTFSKHATVAFGNPYRARLPCSGVGRPQTLRLFALAD